MHDVYSLLDLNLLFMFIGFTDDSKTILGEEEKTDNLL